MPRAALEHPPASALLAADSLREQLIQVWQLSQHHGKRVRRLAEGAFHLVHHYAESASNPAERGYEVIHALPPNQETFPPWIGKGRRQPFPWR